MSCVTCVAETDLPARMQIQRLLTAIVVFCSPYRKIEQSVMKTVRHAASLDLAQPLPHDHRIDSVVPVGLPMRFKRKYEHMDGMVDHTMQPERKLAYRPSLAVTESWVPDRVMKMEPGPMAPIPPRMCDSDIGLVRPPNMFQVSVDV